ncbi:MAG: biotin-dependent carboxyltransferase family protein, partial [Bacteroidetes bacterium]
MNDFLTIHCHKPGLQTTVQDAGRTGYQAFGVPVAGVMDGIAAQVANQLVGNSPTSPALEMTLLGAHFSFSGHGQLAIAGADMSPTLNGQPAPMWTTFSVKTGDRLIFDRAQTGCRAYLAVGGKWEVTQWLESASASPQNGAELTPDSVVGRGHVIRVLPHEPIAPLMVPPEQRPHYPTTQVVRVMAGPEFGRFSGSEIARFFSQSHPVSAQSNRMGYRLETHLPACPDGREIISSGVVPGTIQV